MSIDTREKQVVQDVVKDLTEKFKNALKGIDWKENTDDDIDSIEEMKNFIDNNFDVDKLEDKEQLNKIEKVVKDKISALSKNVDNLGWSEKLYTEHLSVDMKKLIQWKDRDKIFQIVKSETYQMQAPYMKIGGMIHDKLYPSDRQSPIDIKDRAWDINDTKRGTSSDIYGVYKKGSSGAGDELYDKFQKIGDTYVKNFEEIHVFSKAEIDALAKIDATGIPNYKDFYESRISELQWYIVQQEVLVSVLKQNSPQDSSQPRSSENSIREKWQQSSDRLHDTLEKIEYDIYLAQEQKYMIENCPASRNIIQDKIKKIIAKSGIEIYNIREDTMKSINLQWDKKYETAYNFSQKIWQFKHNHEQTIDKFSLFLNSRIKENSTNNEHLMKYIKDSLLEINNLKNYINDPDSFNKKIPTIERTLQMLTTSNWITGYTDNNMWGKDINTLAEIQIPPTVKLQSWEGNNINTHDVWEMIGELKKDVQNLHEKTI